MINKQKMVEFEKDKNLLTKPDFEVYESTSPDKRRNKLPINKPLKNKSLLDRKKDYEL